MPARRISVVTVANIAEATGLSASSVSAVLNGRHVKRRISQETVDRVLAAAKKLRYVPNVTARSLRAEASGRRQVVLSILTSYEAPFALVGQVLRAMEPLIARRGGDAVEYTVNVEVFHAGRLRELPGLSDGRRCNAAIISNTIDYDDQFLASTKFPFPVVLLGRRIPGYPSVTSKSEMMGRQAAEILCGAGRRKLAVLQPSMLTQATRSRLASFITTVEQATGLPPAMITCEHLHENAGHEAMARFLAFKPVCDGIFALSDVLAIGACHAIRQAGRSIPRDIAMVGVGDSPASHYISPPLTSFEDSQDAQNRAAVELLLDLVEGATPGTLTIEVPVSPILRESTGHKSGA